MKQIYLRQSAISKTEKMPGIVTYVTRNGPDSFLIKGDDGRLCRRPWKNLIKLRQFGQNCSDFRKNLGELSKVGIRHFCFPSDAILKMESPPS